MEPIVVPYNRRMKCLVHLIVLLMGNGYSIKELSVRMELPSRTIYRYIRLLESLDFCVEKSFKGKFFIASDKCPVCGNNKIIAA